MYRFNGKYNPKLKVVNNKRVEKKIFFYLFRERGLLEQSMPIFETTDFTDNLLDKRCIEVHKQFTINNGGNFVNG